MKKYIINTIAILTLTTFGCKKITDINVSPNNPPASGATPQILFPSAVGSTVARIGGELNIIGGIWAQYYTQSTTASQYRTIDAYNLTNVDYNTNYNELFSGALQDYQLCITQANAAGLYNYALMATVMKAFTYETMVDLYDQVPYKEALSGQDNLQPAFDKGSDVYNGLLAEIDAALAQNYNVNLGGSDAATDFVFAGDMSKWAQFANTLKLKMYLRMINANPSAAQAGVTKLFASPDFLTTNAAMTVFVNQPNKDNPFYEYNIRSLNTTTNIKASKTLLIFMKTYSDPRIPVIYGVANPVGQDQGDYNNTAFNNATVIAQKATDPVEFISAAESYFLQAEAVVRYGLPGNASDLYNKGITASFIDMGLTSAQASSYYSQPAIAATTTAPEYPGILFPASGTTDQKLTAIITQKWASFAYGTHTLEGFFDQERTGIPAISTNGYTPSTYIPSQWVYSVLGVTANKAFPKRMLFPKSERDRNKNTPAEVPITTPVWWGK